MTRASLRRWPRSLALGLLCLFALAYSTMYSAVSVPNERSRLYLAVAMVDQHTLNIDLSSARFGRILDTASHAGHLYSDKAPGSSFLAAGVYGAVRLFTDPADWKVEELILLMRRALMIPIGLLGFFALRRLLRRTGVVAPWVDLVSLGWMLGSSAFHYSTAFYGHQIVGVALIGALALVLRAEEAIVRSRFSPALVAAAAGACAGVAGLTEYQAGIPAALLALYVLFGPLGRRPLGALGFALGALPFLVLLGWYNTHAFGGPLELSYQHLTNKTLASIHDQGIGGVTVPHWASFYGGILSLHRGLVATSPMFLFAIPGVVALWRRERRRLAVLVGATSLYFVLFISSSNMWVAGWGFGPRLLVPAMGWMCVLVAHGGQMLAKRFVLDAFLRGSIATAILYHQVVHAFFPEPPNNAENPLLDVVVELGRARLVAPNLAEPLLSGLASLLPLALAIALAVGLVLFARGRPRRIAGRVGLPLASLCVLGLLALYVGLAGPSWNPSQRRDFQTYVAGLDPGRSRGLLRH